MFCSVAGCETRISPTHNKSGMCAKHCTEAGNLRATKARQESRPVCKAEGCGKRLKIDNSIGYCREHRYQGVAGYRADYYQANKAHIIQQRSVTNRNRRQQRSTYHTEWRAANPGKVKAGQHKRRALQLGAEGTWTEKEWTARQAEYNNACCRCGVTGIKLTPDHIIALDNGGSNWISNIQPMCKPCNCSKKELFTWRYAIWPAHLVWRP